MLNAIRSGDIVWDVGANVGFYTTRFLERVGPSGRVVAVEPIPSNATICRGLKVAGENRLEVIEAALGAADGQTRMHDNETYSTLSQISDGGSLVVRQMTGDGLLATLKQAPTIVKIDVEGYELEVLRGMPKVLAEHSLRSVFVEVHSAIMEANGLKNGGDQIVRLLASSGFKITWLDFSHLMAVRENT